MHFSCFSTFTVTEDFFMLMLQNVVLQKTAHWIKDNAFLTADLGLNDAIYHYQNYDTFNRPAAVYFGASKQMTENQNSGKSSGFGRKKLFVFRLTKWSKTNARDDAKHRINLFWPKGKNHHTLLQNRQLLKYRNVKSNLVTSDRLTLSK